MKYTPISSLVAVLVVAATVCACGQTAAKWKSGEKKGQTITYKDQLQISGEVCILMKAYAARYGRFPRSYRQIQTAAESGYWTSFPFDPEWTVILWNRGGKKVGRVNFLVDVGLDEPLTTDVDLWDESMESGVVTASRFDAILGRYVCAPWPIAKAHAYAIALQSFVNSVGKLPDRFSDLKNDVLFQALSDSGVDRLFTATLKKKAGHHFLTLQDKVTGTRYDYRLARDMDPAFLGPKNDPDHYRLGPSDIDIGPPPEEASNGK